MFILVEKPCTDMTYSDGQCSDDQGTGKTGGCAEAAEGAGCCVHKTAFGSALRVPANAIWDGEFRYDNDKGSAEIPRWHGTM